MKANIQQNNNINSNNVAVAGASQKPPTSAEIKKQPAATAGAVHQPFVPLIIPQAQITL